MKKRSFVGLALALMLGNRLFGHEREQNGVDLYQDPLPSGGLARMGTTRLRHLGSVTAVFISPDGKTLASGGEDDTIRFWDRATGRQLRQVVIPGRIYALAFSPDGTAVAAVTQDRVIDLLDAKTGRRIRQLVGHAEFIGAIAFSSDGRDLASGSADKTVCIWDIASGNRLHVLRGHQKGVRCLAFSPDGKTLASGGRDQSIRFWDVTSGKELRTIDWYKAQVWVPPENGFAQALAFSPDSRTLTAGTYGDGTIHFWDVASGMHMRRLVAHSQVVTSIAFSPDGKLLASAGLGPGPRLWEVTTGQALTQFKGACSADSVYFSPDGKTLATGDSDGVVRLWDVATGKEQPRPPEHRSEVYTVAFTRDGNNLATLGLDYTIRVWNAGTGEHLLRFPFQSDSQFEPAWGRSVLFPPEGKTVLAVDGADAAGLWDRTTGRQLRRVHLFDRRVPRDPPASSMLLLALSPDGKTLAAESFGVEATTHHTIRLWDLAANQEVRTFPFVPWSREAKEITSLNQGAIPAFSPQGKLLASTSFSQVIRLWDVDTGRELRQLRGHEGRVSGVAFSPDGRYLASSAGAQGRRGRSVDVTLRLWEVATGRQLLQIEGGPSEFFSVAYSPDGKTLASGSEGGSVCLWEVASGAKLLEFRDEGGRINCVAFAPDGRTVASAMSGSTALVWDLAPPGWRQRARTRLAARELQSWWEHLASEHAVTAYGAVWSLSAAPAETLPFLKQNLRPIVPEKPERIRQLIAQLDADAFADREAASRELARLGPQAEPHLRKALAETRSEEVRTRIPPLLQLRESWAVKDPETLRTLRALWVLERIGTPEARAVLEQIAQGDPAARPTQDARAALDRLSLRLPSR